MGKRDYKCSPDHVVRFYKENHEKQTLDFVLGKHKEYLPISGRKEMDVWDAIGKLDSILDQSDPDLDLSQLVHAVQTAEGLRKDGHSEDMVVTGLVHDLGKVLFLFGEPDWAVCGDTFPLGCAFSDKIVFHDFFKNNPDSKHPIYSTKQGIYSENCGLDSVVMSWGHDEYLYHVLKDYLPPPSQYIIRYHSFYACHNQGAYEHLFDSNDRKMMEYVKKFQKYDLYEKSPQIPDTNWKEYYEDLVKRYFPDIIKW